MTTSVAPTCALMTPMKLSSESNTVTLIGMLYAPVEGSSSTSPTSLPSSTVSCHQASSLWR